MASKDKTKKPYKYPEYLPGLNKLRTVLAVLIAIVAIIGIVLTALI